MAGSVVHVSSPWFQSSLVILVALLAVNGTPVVHAEDRVAADRPLSGDGKLVSLGGKFALGFFQPEGGAVGSWYVGIWYHNISVCTPVWVANRDRPVSDPAASRLTIAADGNLVLLNARDSRAWSTNTRANNRNTTAVLLDTGNLVLTHSSNASDVLWQSFDHFGDTWLPGAKLRWNKVTGDVQGMTSWRSRWDPAPGPYTLQLDPAGAPLYTLLWNGTRAYYWDTVDWNGRILLLADDSFQFVDDDRESYFTYGFAENSTVVFRFVLDVSGQVKGWLWTEDTKAWNLVYEEPSMRCDVPNICGTFGMCNESAASASDSCRCARGFTPRNASRWSLGDYTGGCVRSAELQCGKNSSELKAMDDRFFLMAGVRLPDYGLFTAAASSSCGDCERACLGGCTCSAYAYNGDCILWHGDLQNLGDFYAGADVGDLYLRLAASELPGVRSHDKRRTVEIAVGALAVVCFIVAASVLVVRTIMSRLQKTKVQGLECCVASFKYRNLESFTNNFCHKLGSGAFGSVFRGQLPDRTTTIIAVKKLEGLRQGEKQFRAEVSTLGTIHHVNLIRLIGFCSDSIDRKLLIYEYMPNGSLDRHLFGARQNKALSWRARYQIAVGVAKGLAYLHDKCRDCIIHCDIKPENILLDDAFVPKVADFGLAKLMGHDFSRVLTTMRGTIGYLAPEWISGEPITTKADVYSYGMMLFEIVSGKRNTEHGSTESGNEPSSGSDYTATEFFPVLVARRLAEAKAGDVKTLLDPALEGDADDEEVRRVCKVACWCIQDEVDARPTMAEVVLVLEGVMQIDVPPVPRYLEILVGRWMYATGYDYDYSS